MVWAERFEPDPNDADAVAYRLWKDQKNRQNCQRRERKRKRQEEAAAARAVPQRVASVVPPRVARVASPESEEEATLSELEAQLEAPQPAEAQQEDKEEHVIMSHKP